MTTDTKPDLESAFKSLSNIASLLVILTGALVIVGWMFSIPALKSVLPDLAVMKFNAAVCFMLAGVGLRLLQNETASIRRRRTAQVCALLVAAIGLLTLSEYVFNWDPGIDELVFKADPSPITSYPGRMPPGVALSFVLLAAAMLLLSRETAYLVSQWLGLFVAGFGLLATLGYLYGMVSLHNILFFRSIALHAALAFMVIGTGVIFARPRCGLMRLLAHPGPGGVLVRRILPIILVLLIALNWLLLQGELAGLYDETIYALFFTAISIVMVTAILWWRAAATTRIDSRRRRAEAALSESEEKYRTLFEQANDAILLLDMEGHYLDANRRAETMLGYTRDELLKMSFRDLVAPQELPQSQQVFGVLTTGEIIPAYERLYRRKNGDIFPVEINAAVVRSPAGKPPYVLSIVRDVTERKLADERLRESEFTFRYLFMNNPHPMWVYDRETLAFLDVNDTAAARYGYTRDEFLNMRITDIRLAEDVPRLLENVAQPRPSVQFSGEWRHRLKDGTIIDVDITSHDIDFQGRKAVLVVAQDITTRKRAETALHRVNRAYRTLSDCNQILIRATDEQKLFEDLCRIIVETGGYRMAWIGLAEHDEAKTVRPAAHAGHEEGYLQTARVVWDDVERGRGPTGTAVRTGQPQVIRDFFAHPSFAPWREEALKRGYASCISLPIRDNGHILGALSVYSVEPDGFDDDEITLLVELAGDLGFGITTLRTRAAHQQAEEQIGYLASLLENVSDAVISTDMVVVRSWNKAAETIYGWRADEVIGRPLGDFLRNEYLNTTAETVIREFEEQGYWSGEVIQNRKDGSTVHIFSSVTMITDSKGSRIGAVGVNRDITERKRLEQELRDSEMLRIEVQKERELIALKERFISMVSHEFRTPLTVILSSTQILQKYHDRLKSERQLEHLSKIESQTQYMTGLLNDVLTISKARAGKLEFNPTPIHLVNCCQLFLEQIQLNMSAAHRLVFNHDSFPDYVLLDEKLLQHILVNLLSNAVKYSPDGGEIRLDLFDEEGWIAIRVSDRGMGIPPKDQPRLFEPFHRAHNVGQIEGTGLGLAIVKESIDLHGGTIEFESEEGVGTTFTVRLPRRS